MLGACTTRTHNGVNLFLKFGFSKKATKIDEIFTVDLTVCSKCQIDGEDFFKFVAFLKNINFNKSHFSKLLLSSL